MDGPWLMYTPDEPHGENIMFLHCGVIDWYVYRESIAAKYLLLISPDGVIMKAASEDKADIVPVGMYTATTESLPDDFKPGKYCWDQGFKLREVSDSEIEAKNRRIRARKLKVVSEEISLLTTLSLADTLSPEDSVRLENLKHFVKSLMSVDLFNPQWPVGSVPDESDTWR